VAFLQHILFIDRDPFPVTFTRRCLPNVRAVGSPIQSVHSKTLNPSSAPNPANLPATDNIQGAEQMGVVNCSARSARAIVAGVVALLIVLQGLTSVGSSFARPLGGEEKASFLGSILSVTCANTQDHNRSPKHAHDFSKCCILCGGRDLTGTALFILPKTGGMNPLPRALVAIAKSILVAPRIVVLGWTSTWSSRAPPSFS
jgi:hypothetical protein